MSESARLIGAITITARGKAVITLPTALGSQCKARCRKNGVRKTITNWDTKLKKELRQAKEKVADWNRLKFNIGSDVLDSKMKKQRSTGQGGYKGQDSSLGNSNAL